MERLQRLPSRVIVCADLDTQRPLTRCRHDVEWIEERALTAQAQSLEAGDREQCRIETFAAFDFSDAGRDVAAQRYDFQIGSQEAHLGDTAQARRADTRALRQRLQRLSIDERFTRIVARRDCSKAKTGR